jgi:hypothetical protein
MLILSCAMRWIKYRLVIGYRKVFLVRQDAAYALLGTFAFTHVVRYGPVR